MRRSTVAALLLALTLLLAAVASSHRSALALRAKTPIDEHTFVPSPGVGRVLSLGENELFADLAWVKTLIYYGTGLVHDTGMPDVDELVELINVLDPKFRRPYLWGAYATTFRKRLATQEEYESSVAILRRGVAQFPQDWELSWILGFRLFLDIKGGTPAEERERQEEGAMFIGRAMRLPGAPASLALLATSLRTRLGQTERALRELREMILITEDPKARETLQARFAALASEAQSKDLGRDAETLDAAWKRAIPFAPRTLFILLGPRPDGGIDLRKMAVGHQFLVEEESIEQD